VMAGRPRKKEKRAVFSIDVTVPVSAIKPHLDLRWIKAVDAWACECSRNVAVSRRPESVQGPGLGEAACLTSQIERESEPEDLAIHWMVVRPPSS
jgi:hypothetical protein